MGFCIFPCFPVSLYMRRWKSLLLTWLMRTIEPGLHQSTSSSQVYKSLHYFFTGLPNFLHQTQSVWREEGGKSPVGEMVARQGEIKGSQTCGRENVHCTVIWLTCTVCRFQWQYTVYRRQRDFYVVLTVCQEPFRMYSAGYTIHATMPPTVGCSGGIKDAIYCNKKLTPLFLSLFDTKQRNLPFFFLRWSLIWWDAASRNGILWTGIAWQGEPLSEKCIFYYWS